MKYQSDDKGKQRGAKRMTRQRKRKCGGKNGKIKEQREEYNARE